VQLSVAEPWRVFTALYLRAAAVERVTAEIVLRLLSDEHR
jgi:hypothetical protein